MTLSKRERNLIVGERFRYKIYNANWDLSGVAKRAMKWAMTGQFNGRQMTNYFWGAIALHQPTGSFIQLTRDVGHHTCGWWKNPEYERCFHLSLSFRDPETGESREQDHALAKQWLQHCFGDNYKLIWAEPPYSDKGKEVDAWHYRLFMHPDWKTPLLPRGEVYTKEFTEAGWRSFSELQAEITDQRQREMTRRLD